MRNAPATRNARAEQKGAEIYLSRIRISWRNADQFSDLDLQVSGGRAAPADARRRAIDATVERLVAAGATVLGEHLIGEDLDHVVMADPEGNELCVV